jgi:hypothetical protein
MYHLLLTGAGFSYNWGGFLANEAFEYLLAATEGDDDLRSTLWHDHDSHFARAGLGNLDRTLSGVSA